MLQQQLETMVEQNDWTPHDKATYLITALNKLDARILHGAPTGAMYLVTAALENHYGDHLEQAFHAQLKRRTMLSICGRRGVMHVLLPASVVTPPASDRTQSYGPGHFVALTIF
jgi:hypothetical protein